MTLGIQSNIAGRLSVWLFDRRGQPVTKKSRAIGPGETFHLLSLVAAVMRKASAIRQIVVVRGPGPFTPVRTGFVIAKTLGLIWSVPVRGIVAGRELTANEWTTKMAHLPRWMKSSAPIRPYYGRQPNISRPRKRVTLPRGGRGRGRTASK